MCGAGCAAAVWPLPLIECDIPACSRIHTLCSIMLSEVFVTVTWYSNGEPVITSVGRFFEIRRTLSSVADDWRVLVVEAVCVLAVPVCDAGCTVAPEPLLLAVFLSLFDSHPAAATSAAAVMREAQRAAGRDVRALLNTVRLLLFGWCDAVRDFAPSPCRHRATIPAGSPGAAFGRSVRPYPEGR